MNLTYEELERRAYIEGDTQMAELYAQCIDSEDLREQISALEDEKEDLEYQIRDTADEKERADTAEMKLASIQDILNG